LYPEYSDPTDKMFCGVDYSDASSACLAGGAEGASRHCPDMECAIAGQSCFVDMPCSYFAMTNPEANPLLGFQDMEVSITEMELPDPGTELATTFCGATFQEAAASCSSITWCRNGNSQECPNGMTCFVGVNADNPECEINAITKAEYEEAKLNSKVPSLSNSISPSTLPPVALSDTDPKNQNFCGTDWEDASNNCSLERFCPNGDGDCDAEGHTCQTYTTCNAVGMTGAPT
jgi:hypothetical protein